MRSSNVVLRLGWLCALVAVSNCRCPTLPTYQPPGNGPLQDTPPPDLGSRGLVVEQPENSEPVLGSWATVSGWFDPAQVRDVLVLGAPVDGFYLPTGHVGVPTVPVSTRTDGRFYAPRVPLVDGTNTITIIPLAPDGTPYGRTERTVVAADTASVPATLVVDPPQPAPGQAVTLRAATGQSASLSWQWDLDGDGVFDQDAVSATHTFAAAGQHSVTARTRVNNRWVSAYARVTVGQLPEPLAQSTAVTAPSRVWVIPRFTAPPWPVQEDGTLAPDVLETRHVVVRDGDALKVFDASLLPRFTLTGLSRPGHVAGDAQGRLYVADTGNNRVVRFDAAGNPDTTFATAGAYTGTSQQPLARPVFVAVGPVTAHLILEDGTSLRCGGGELDGSGNNILDTWADVECDADTLAQDPIYAALLAQDGVRFVSRPTALFDESTGQAFTAVSTGQLVRLGLGQAGVHNLGITVRDVAVAPAAHLGGLAVLDDAGRVHTFMRGQRTGRWVFPAGVTALAAGADARLVTASPGRVEIRALEGWR